MLSIHTTWMDSDKKVAVTAVSAAAASSTLNSLKAAWITTTMMMMTCSGTGSSMMQIFVFVTERTAEIFESVQKVPPLSDEVDGEDARLSRCREFTDDVLLLQGCCVVYVQGCAGVCRGGVVLGTITTTTTTLLLLGGAAVCSTHEKGARTHVRASSCFCFFRGEVHQQASKR